MQVLKENRIPQLISLLGFLNFNDKNKIEN